MIMPLRQAIATIWARSPAPIFLPMRARWFFTVNAEIDSRVAITLFDRPSATNLTTCNSRTVSSETAS